MIVIPPTRALLWSVLFKSNLSTHVLKLTITLILVQKFARSFSQPTLSDSLTMPTIPFRNYKSSREISIDVSFPYILHDARATTVVVPKPHESVHYFPVVAKKQPRTNTLTKMLRGIKSIPKCIPSFSSSTSISSFTSHLLSPSSSSLSLS
jgi:hypothetical protein